MFRERKLAFGPPQYQTLGLLTRDGLYTNLALLLSDQCPFGINIARFRTTSAEKFQDRHAITGSLFQQLQRAYEYLDLCNPTEATFDEPARANS